MRGRERRARRGGRRFGVAPRLQVESAEQFRHEQERSKHVRSPQFFF